MTSRKKICIGLLNVFLLSSSCAKSAGIGEHITLGGLLAIHFDSQLPHEGKAMGVPDDYDWASGPRLGVGNDPSDNSTMTGWGQIFWASNADYNDNLVQIRNFKVLACNGITHKWVQLQDGQIEGAEFRADYKENFSESPNYLQQTDEVTTVGFDQRMVFHFWPKLAHANLPSKNLCGFLVLLQSRVVPGKNNYQVVPKSFLVGLGADYWYKIDSKWDNQKTNPNIMIGRFRYIDSTWSWFGASTASGLDIERLYLNGYELNGQLKHLEAE